MPKYLEMQVKTQLIVKGRLKGELLWAETL